MRVFMSVRACIDACVLVGFKFWVSHLNSQTNDRQDDDNEVKNVPATFEKLPKPVPKHVENQLLEQQIRTVRSPTQMLAEGGREEEAEGGKQKL